ncbi:MAG TPA: hypothetical protein VF041_02200 [Gemmatimonadaceae bacterium]
MTGPGAEPTTATRPATPPRAPGAVAGAPGGMTPSAGALPLAAEHFAASMLYLIAGAAGLVWIAPELAAGAYPSPHVAGITHLFTLGWLTTTIFGALCQLLPVALGAPIRSTRIAHASFFTFAPGVGLFAAGVATSYTPLHHAGIALVGTGVLLVVGNVAASLPRARARDVTWAAVALAITFLASTLVLGIILLHNLHTGFIAGARVRVLATHLHVAIVGWALVMIVGVSHRLLPMFLLAHGADTRWTRRALALLAGGVVALAVGLATPIASVAWLGALLLEGGVACFLWQVHAFHRVRVRRKIDVGMRFALTALGFLAASAVMGPAVLAMGPAHARLATAYVATGLLGGIVLYVVGFFYKIVPLLAWTAHFRGRMGSGPVPTVAEMYSARLAHVQLALMALGVALLVGGIVGAAPHVARCGAVLFLVGVLVFTTQIARVAHGGRK